MLTEPKINVYFDVAMYRIFCDILKRKILILPMRDSHSTLNPESEC